MSDEKHILHIHYKKENKKTIIFFPYAGGFANQYFLWKKYFNDNYNLLAIEYPGRGIRSKDLFLSSFQQLLKDNLQRILPYIKNDYILVGQSLGAYLAYELGCILQFKYSLPPKMIMAISAVSPFQFDANKIETLINLPDDELITALGKLGEIDNNFILDTDFKNYFLDVIRNDLKTIATYIFKNKGQLNFPIISCVGDEDHLCIREDYESNWKNLTIDYYFKRFKGGHFFANHNIKPLVDLICEIN